MKTLSPREWNKDIDDKLKKLGFRQCEADSNLYIPTFKNGCFLLLYVDDILLIGPSDGIENVKRMLKQLYKMKDLGPASLFLGIEIERLPDGRIKLSQTRYIETLLERFGMTDCNRVRLPMKKDLQNSEDDHLPADEHKDYQSIVGGGNWVACVARPDISYTLSRLSSCQNQQKFTKKLQSNFSTIYQQPRMLDFVLEQSRRIPNYMDILTQVLRAMLTTDGLRQDSCSSSMEPAFIGRASSNT
jgi:hypothetical protein